MIFQTLILQEWADYTPNVYSLYFANKYLCKYTMDKNLAEKLINNWEKDELMRSFIAGENQKKAREAFQKIADSFHIFEELSHLDRAQDGDLFRNTTFVHGDLHSGNLFIQNKDGAELETDRKVVICDWQTYGRGHNTSELAYFLGNSIKFDPEVDRKLMHAYYEEMTRDFGGKGALVRKEEYPFSIFERELAVRIVGFATGTLALLVLDTPEERRIRNEKNRKMLYLDESRGQLMQNSIHRAIHVIDDPERDFKTFIWGAKQE